MLAETTAIYPLPSTVAWWQLKRDTRQYVVLCDIVSEVSHQSKVFSQNLYCLIFI